MDVQIADFDGLESSLHWTLDRLGEIRAGPRVDSEAFFAASFMREHTQYDTYAAFRDDAPVDIDAPPLDESPDHRQRVNAFVAEVTEFESWEEMQTRAAQEEVVDQLLSNTA